MNDIRDDLKAFVDGELSPERMTQVQEAIDSDPRLHREVEYMRLLGFEIKKLAAEPAVVGKEQVVSRFRKDPLPWWNPATLSGRFAYAGALFFCLFAVSALLFPVFAQSKSASKKTAEMSRMKQEALAWQQRAGGAADMAAGGAPATQSPEFIAKAPGDEGAGSPEEREYQNQRVPPASPNPAYADGSVMAENGLVAESPATLKGRTETATGKEKSASPPRSRPMTKPSVRRQSSTQPPKTTPPPPLSNRMVIKNADITVRVDDAKRALTEAENLAKGLGGYTEGSNMSSVPGQTPSASIVIRVPARNYETAMARLREMGEVPNENTNAQDVTAEHADLDGRLRVLRAEEESYVTMLRAARKVGELMEIKDRLSSVRQQIASMESQRKALAGEAALSTIRATFEQKAKLEDDEKGSKKSGFDETWAKALNGLSNVGEFLGNAAIYLFVFSPVWLPPVILFWWLGKRAKAS